jgi:hypothetical protein
LHAYVSGSVNALERLKEAKLERDDLLFCEERNVHMAEIGCAQCAGRGDGDGV